MVRTDLLLPAAQSLSRLRRQLPLHKGAFAARYFVGSACKICPCVPRGRGKPLPYITTNRDAPSAAGHELLHDLDCQQDEDDDDGGFYDL